MEMRKYEAMPFLKEEVNFQTWKFRINLLLEEKGVVEAIKSEKPTKEMDIKARSIIVQCVSDKYISYIKKCTTSLDMMKCLEVIFERKSVFNKLQLKRRLLNLKCQKDTKLQDHYLRFDNIINEIEIGESMSESDKVCHLLLTLPDSYENVITSLETMSTEKEITIDFVKARLLDAELKMKSYSENRNHETGTETSFSTENIVCYKCKQKGHKAYQCRNNQRGRYFRGNNFGRGRRNDRGRDGQANITKHMFTAYDETIHMTNEYIESNVIEFIIDSGASDNMVQDKYKNYMTKIQTLKEPVKIKVANGEYLEANERGILETEVKGRCIDIEALIVPNLTQNLLSVSKLVEKNSLVIFQGNVVKIIQNDLRVYGEKFGKLYKLQLKIKTENECHTTANDTSLWHQRLGHLNRNGLRTLNLPNDEKRCDVCMRAKSTRLPFYPVVMPRSEKVCELLHTDIAGPVNVPSINEERYYQIIVDDYTHFGVIYLLKYKHEATQNLIDYVRYLERQKQNKVKRVRCDNGGEFKNRIINEFAKKNGIKMEYTIPYSPQMNGVSERMNRTVYNKARALMMESNLPKELWGEAVKCAMYQINRCPSAAIKFKTPAELYYGKYEIDNMKIFGSKAWMIVLPRKSKFEERAKAMRFIGYSTNGYRLWDPESNGIKISRDVHFDETNVRYDGIRDIERDNVRSVIYRELDEKESKSSTSGLIERKGKSEIKVSQRPTVTGNEEDSDDEDKFDDATEQVKEVIQEKLPEEKYTRSGRRIVKPKRLQEYETHYAYGTYMEDVPKSYNEAIKMGWNEAIAKELNALENMKTWTITDLPNGKEAIDAKWIFVKKDNNLKKARLVARGFLQRDDGFTVNYSPVARMSTVRTFLSHAVQNDFEIHQMDIPTAFLNGILESDVYLKIPKGVKCEQKDKVLKLNRSLYGLKESPKCWNDRLNDFILKIGLIRSNNDFCMYYNDKCWIIVFVDDILVTGCKEEITYVKEKLKKEFQAKDFGEVEKFLGMEIHRNGEILKITQENQIDKMLKKFNMSEANGTKCPMTKGFQADSDSKCVDVPYRQLIGGLMFLATVSRPDIAFSTTFLSQYLDRPTLNLWTQAKRVLRYLKETKTSGLTYVKNNKKNVIETYSDADWGGNHIDRKSISGSVTLLNSHVVAWFSRKQNCVALSTAEAEYVAGATSACDLINIKGLCKNTNKSPDVQCVLYVDNKGAIDMTKTFENSKRTKHIDIKYHFIKDLIFKKELVIEYVNTVENLADIFTKTLGVDRFKEMCEKLNIC